MGLRSFPVEEAETKQARIINLIRILIVYVRCQKTQSFYFVNPLRTNGPNRGNPNQIFPVGDGFGFLLLFSYDFFSSGLAIRENSKLRGPRRKEEYDS